ncbi:hypothetical protein B0H10DRAFT_1952916 [Mycena sp. CBHHK59/15]|nr:hypothetical protein B0H10DRAFT_1952916 [Mycena sp. CBHHK59/15]
MQPPVFDSAIDIQRLLTDIGYRYELIPPYDVTSWGPLHTWMLEKLAPGANYHSKKLTDLEHVAGGIEIYLGEAQQNGLLELYHLRMKELADICLNDAVLRGIAVVPWINSSIRASWKRRSSQLSNMKFECYRVKQAVNQSIIQGEMTEGDSMIPRPAGTPSLEVFALKFGVAEAYAEGVFKAGKDQR